MSGKSRSGWMWMAGVLMVGAIVGAWLRPPARTAVTVPTAPIQRTPENVTPREDKPGAVTRAVGTSKEMLTHEEMFHGYTVRIWDGPGLINRGCLEIWKGDNLAYTRRGGKFQVGLPQRGTKGIPMGSDVTGQGIPEVVVSEWNGSAHGNYEVSIFELGDPVRRIVIPHTLEGAGYFDRAPGEAAPVFIDWDGTFAYWFESFAASPMPKVVLHFRNGKYRLAAELMRTPRPAPSEIEAQIKKARTGLSWTSMDGGSRFWGYMLNLIYHGHADLAWEFFDRAWTGPGKAQFLAAFKERLRSSPFWPEVLAMNEGSSTAVSLNRY